MPSSGVVGVPLGTESEVARGARARVNPPGALGRRVCYVKLGQVKLGSVRFGCKGSLSKGQPTMCVGRTGLFQVKLTYNMVIEINIKRDNEKYLHRSNRKARGEGGANLLWREVASANFC